MPRITPLLSSKTPSVNSGEVVLPVLTAVGEWAELSASPTQWRKIVVDLAKLLDLDVRPKSRRANSHACEFEKAAGQNRTRANLKGGGR